MCGLLNPFQPLEHRCSRLIRLLSSRIHADPRSQGGGRGGERKNWQQISRENEKFENYYNSQAFIPEEEKEAFWAALKRDLPNSFRFTGSRGYVMRKNTKRAYRSVTTPQIKAARQAILGPLLTFMIAQPCSCRAEEAQGSIRPRDHLHQI